MNNILLYLQLSPLYPLKGRFVANIGNTKLATISPLRGLGVSKQDNKFLSQLKTEQK
jgi:hypothetical protein